MESFLASTIEKYERSPHPASFVCPVFYTARRDGRAIQWWQLRDGSRQRAGSVWGGDCGRHRANGKPGIALQPDRQNGQPGNFTLVNTPYNNYHVSVTASGFQSSGSDVNVRSPLPLDVKIGLKIGTAAESVAVTAEAADLLENDPTAHTDVDRGLFDKLPLESQSSSLSSLVTIVAPGVAADSNGLFHGLGDHAENSFSVNGQKITDQQSKVFSNQLPVDAVQSLEVIQGAPPAEYGGKTSLVIVATTRSGLGITQPHGDLTASYGTFGTSGGAFDLSYCGQTWGNFIAVDGLNTGRFWIRPNLRSCMTRATKRMHSIDSI